MNDKCCGGEELKLLYACSGCANVGEIADRAARYLTANGCAKMTCLSAVGASLPGFIKSANAAAVNVTLDGCIIACGKKILQGAGISAKSILITDMGCVKNETPVTDEVVKEISEKLLQKFPNYFSMSSSSSSGNCDCACDCSGE
ncbi:putative zinc-binding protein [Candidatus Calescamantes bacterium]|nr:putative zinc-binding protein [Candidatus Calescamantes bacterium]MCK5598312.1 putative zinc-binding protein [bacterium]